MTMAKIMFATKTVPGSLNWLGVSTASERQSHRLAAIKSNPVSAQPAKFLIGMPKYGPCSYQIQNWTRNDSCAMAGSSTRSHAVKSQAPSNTL